MNHVMKFLETQCEVFQADAKTKLLSHVWLPEEAPKAIFLAIHGGMAHAGDWVTPAQYFTGKGIAVYALDLRWHGTYLQYNDDVNMFHIDSYDTYTRDIEKYYAEIQKNHPDTPIFILGHSNGALIALHYGLTIGEEITARHHADEASGLRSSKATVGLAAALEKAQGFVTKHIAGWGRTPVIGFIAGKDELADPGVSNQVLNSITAAPVTLHNYPENFHENFNERNRDEIFATIADWIEDKI